MRHICGLPHLRTHEALASSPARSSVVWKNHHACAHTAIWDMLNIAVYLKIVQRHIPRTCQEYSDGRFGIFYGRFLEDSENNVNVRPQGTFQLMIFVQYMLNDFFNHQKLLCSRKCHRKLLCIPLLQILLNLSLCQEASIGIFHSRGTLTIFPGPSRKLPVEYPTVSHWQVLGIYILCYL